MIARLITGSGMYSIALPQKVSGRYWISDIDENGFSRKAISIEGIQRQWILSGSEAIALCGDDGEVPSVVLKNEDTQVVFARYRDTHAEVSFFAEPSTRDRTIFSKFCVPDEFKLNIGRAEGNHIVFRNQYASSHHACLMYRHGEWSITDTQSSNGTFVNGQRVAMKMLRPGDVIYIMGLKIIIGNRFFAINNPDGCVEIKAQGVLPLISQMAEERDEFISEAKQDVFYRAPRFRRTIQREEIRVDAPPARQRVEEVPIALLVGPALTMGMTAVIMAIIAFNNYLSGSATLASMIPTLAMSVSMLCGTMLWPMLTKKNEKKKRLAGEELRAAKYREYLDGLRDRIYTLCRRQHEILLENSPNITECLLRAETRSPDLWERTAMDEDFLNLRLGIDDTPLDVDMRYPEERFALDEDYLFNELLRFTMEPKVIKDAPLTHSLAKASVTGVVGKRDAVDAFVQGLIMQLATLHGYDEVKLVIIVSEAEAKRWASFRWLPHMWNGDDSVRYWVTDEATGKALSAVLNSILARRIEVQGRAESRHLPHYVIVAADMALAERVEIFNQVINCPPELGFSCIALASTAQELPKECSAVVELNEQNAVKYDRSTRSGVREVFQPEYPTRDAAERFMSALANLRLDGQDGNYVLPNLISFLELYGVGKVEHLNVASRWKENNPVQTLRTPIGMGEDGEVFYLDLHEKFHGPHGLVAGMTGSGKSEFIITYILSLAVNFRPDEVSFILIDYKGGGLAGAFDESDQNSKLPHLAGTITNLDGASVKRSLVSIQSELRRRQAIFNQARQVSGEGTIDIYKYQRMYRQGLVKEPVSHLFIISDEFAELKAQQPEFMDQLISAARIGRSLGVHLILATQKPSGVVDDQIWSNSRFRACLKVQERGDSMDMIKRPDAAELKETGRFYLQVGFNEFFALGQSAWAGAPYIPADRMEKKYDESVAVLGALGSIRAEAKPKNTSRKESAASQIVSIVNYLADVADGEEIESRQLWLPALPEIIDLMQLRKKYEWKPELMELSAVVGEYDDPSNQEQGLVSIPFSEEGNVLVYSAAGGGKSTLLNAVLYGLLSDYTAEQLNIYILDFGEETLRVFEQAPQVGGVVVSSDKDRVVNLIQMVQEELNRRKELFSDTSGDYRSYCATEGQKLPHILLVLRNYVAFSEQFEQLEGQLMQVAREGTKYGIYLLVTANAPNEIRYRVSQNFSQSFALQFNDRSDYIGLFGGTDGVYPSKVKGRGIFKSERAYEFQAASFAKDAGQEELKVFVEKLRESATCFAKQIPILPDRVTTTTLAAPVTREAFPVGVEKSSFKASCLDLRKIVAYPILGQDEYEVGGVAQGLAEQLTRLESESVTVLDAAGAFSVDDNESAYRYIKTDFAPQVEELFAEMVYRNNTYKTAINNGTELPVFDSKYYVITGMQNILDGLDAVGQDKLLTLLEKAEVEYCIHFFVCDSVKGLGGQIGTTWYRRHISGADGIWVGNGFGEQHLIKANRMSSELYSELDSGLGYVLRRGKVMLVKIITGENWEEEK